MKKNEPLKPVLPKSSISSTCSFLFSKALPHPFPSKLANKALEDSYPYLWRVYKYFLSNPYPLK